ncbi:MAG: vWA domain-containing protein [Patescibacteria group bacterium]|nr:vWA domain-containing protein [Patescibacteria group bacterium]
MNQWSIQRKRIIFSIVVLTLIILIGVPIFFLFYRAPTCFDGKQNGDETGVDCGGSCQLLCTAQSLPLILKGDPRVLKIADNTFEIVALIENPNASGEVYRAGYVFKLYGASSTIPLKVVEGETYIPRGVAFAIFEEPFILEAGVVPTRVILEWKKESLVWQRNTREMPELVVKDSSLLRLSREDTRPRLDASVENLSLENVSNIDLVAVISDETNNIFAASKTFIDTLPAGGGASIVFTWPEPFKIKEYICSYPVDVALVMDRSGSMTFLGTNPPQPLTNVKSAARYFTDQLEGNTLYSLISFANEATKPVDATLDVGLETIQRAINNISIATTSLQNTNIGAGILAAREELNSARHRKNASKALVLLTDGVSNLPVKVGVGNYPEIYALESAGLARQDSISIYTIGLGKDVNMNFLRILATTTAEAYFAPSTEELNSIYNQIATKICKKSLAKINIYVRILPDGSFLR